MVDRPGETDPACDVIVEPAGWRHAGKIVEHFGLERTRKALLSS